jgi:drug/metabolite transporter (DMT)-like permease
VWRTPSLFDLGLLLLGSVSNLSQICMIRGYRIGEASALAPFEYARLPLAALYGYLLFAELPDLYTLLGASIIVASAFWTARREHRLGQQKPPDA